MTWGKDKRYPEECWWHFDDSSFEEARDSITTAKRSKKYDQHLIDEWGAQRRAVMSEAFKTIQLDACILEGGSGYGYFGERRESVRIRRKRSTIRRWETDEDTNDHVDGMDVSSSNTTYKEYKKFRKEYQREYQRDRYKAIKETVTQELGGACSICGEEDSKKLRIRDGTGAAVSPGDAYNMIGTYHLVCIACLKKKKDIT